MWHVNVLHAFHRHGQVFDAYAIEHVVSTYNAACEGSWRERCCAAVCQALHDSGPSLLRSGLSAEVIAGGGLLVTAVQVSSGLSAACTRGMRRTGWT